MYHLIVNAANKNKKYFKAVDTVVRVFADAGKELEVHETACGGDGKNIAALLTRGGRAAKLIAMGGDGTLHEVLNGIENTQNCVLGVIPFGSGNDFADAAGIPIDVKRAAENIVFTAPSPIDYIRLENGLRSINAVGTGIDVDALKRAYSGRKKGKARYLPAFIKSLMHYKSTTFKVSFDGGEESEHTGLITCLGNGRFIGGGIELFPEAKLSDGYMDLVIVDYLSRAKTVGAFLKLKKGKINEVKEVTHVKCKKVCFTAENAPIQAEGEIYENVKLNAELVSGKLKFYLPYHD